MDKTVSMLFSLLRAALWPERREPIAFSEAIDWPKLYRLASEQGVLAMVWDGLQRVVREEQIAEELLPPRSLKLQWAVNVEQIEQRYRRQEGALATLAAFYQRHQIRLMLLKGYGLSLQYPVPEHRPCGDLDIWLYGEQQRADDLLRAKGVKIDEDKHHHTVFSVKGVMVENHYDFLNVHSHRSNREVERWLQIEAREGGRTISVGEAAIELPSPDFNALFLLRHAAAHFAAAEIGLRQLIDWVLFVHHDGALVDWPKLVGRSRKVNMHRFLAVINRLSVDYLGLDRAAVEAVERMLKADDELTRRSLHDILFPRYGVVPQRGLLTLLCFKLRRWWAHRWKHRMVYREGLLQTFFVQLWSHLLKPKSFTH